MGVITALVAIFGILAVGALTWWFVAGEPMSDDVMLVPDEARAGAVLDVVGVGQRTEITSVEHVAVRANTAPDTLQRWGTPLVALLAWAGMTGGGLLLYRVLDSAVKGAPFVHDNVRRLRRLALIAVGGAVVTYVAPLVLDPGPLADLPEGVSMTLPIPFLSWFGLLAVAAVSAVLAAVFERGVQLANAEARTI